MALTEEAIIARLTQGLGDMVDSVTSYGGEFDGDDPGRVVASLPAVWVTSGGVTRSVAMNTTLRKWKVTGRFVVLVGDYNVRSELASRTGGERDDEPGTYRLTYAVRRLLAGQDLGLAISPLRPGAVRTLFSRQLADNAISVLACEFDADWIAHTLENGRWPEEERDSTKADHLFTLHNGRRDEPVPDLVRVDIRYNPPGTGETDNPTDRVELRRDQNEGKSGGGPAGSV
ncbi:DUF1834 family protein [Salmonella enterica]|nr:DUF1834 family protein [Salmonella enterica subsp. enterica serovar Muenchen]EEG7645889.1 DUF1834 family protein [Salmonella enterica]EEH4757994.1 DUF1834 family protein [Salmonella enterica subsp. enterica serovar Muenchen]EFO8041120.1 DUF1834 family protein [Salmonella enterica]EHM5475336.1 DUF1834 family protein [Salmonella enterica]